MRRSLNRAFSAGEKVALVIDSAERCDAASLNLILRAANRPGWIKFGEPPYKLPDPAPAEHWVCPEPGTLVLFPAYMWHGTVPISGKAPRVTAPLDVQPGVAP